jgi:hypothetical protein
MTTLSKDLVRNIALANGFKLKLQPDGEMELNPYVYDFAELIAQMAISHHLAKDSKPSTDIDSTDWDEVDLINVDMSWDEWDDTDCCASHCDCDQVHSLFDRVCATLITAAIMGAGAAALLGGFTGPWAPAIGFLVFIISCLLIWRGNE